MSRDPEDLEGLESWEHPDYAEQAYEQADLERKRLKEDGPNPEAASVDAASESGWPFRVHLELSREAAQKLYDHTGTMPYAPGSWSNEVRLEAADALAFCTKCGVAPRTPGYLMCASCAAAGGNV